MFDFEIYKNMFDTYAKKYIDLCEKDEDKTLIKYKLEHTYRVKENMGKIANSCNLNEHDMFLAKLIGLFHDIGRFKQYHVYKTYDDKKSVEHAKYSAQILKENNMLKGLDESDFNVVYKSVYYHSVFLVESIEEKLTSKELFFLNMIRDADRLDIYESMANMVPKMSKEEQFVWYNERDLNGDISDLIYTQIKEYVSPSMKDCKSVSESIFARFSWVFRDFSFKEGINIIITEKYFEKIYDYMIKTSRVNELYKIVMEYMNELVRDDSNFVIGY